MSECSIELSFLHQVTAPVSAEETDRQASADVTMYQDDLSLVN